MSSKHPKCYVGAALTDAVKAAHLDWKLVEMGYEPSFPWWTRMDSSESSFRALAQIMISDVGRSDIVCLLLPGGRGMHVELGACLESIQQKKVFLIGEPKSDILFYHHPRCVHVATVTEAVAMIPNLKES